MFRKTLWCFALVLISVASHASPSAVVPSARKKFDSYLEKQVKNTILKRAKLLQTCWLTYLEADPATSKLRVYVDWQIKADGSVLVPEIVRPENLEPRFSKCLLEKLSAIQFPPHENKTPKYVSHKFNFTKVQ